MTESILIRQRAHSGAGFKSDFADLLTILSVWLLTLGGGLVREVLGQTELVSFGFYTLHSIDPGIVVSALAVVAHLARGRIAWRPYTIPIIVMAALITTNFMRGMMIDSAASLLWIRANGGIATILMLAICMRPTPQVMSAVRNALLLMSLALCILIVLRLAFGPTLFMTFVTSDADANDGGRPLSAFGTFLLVLASGLLASDMFRRRNFILSWRVLFALALPIFVFITRQGTATIAEIAMLAAMFIFQRGRAQWWRILLGVVLTICAIIAVNALSDMLSSSDTIVRRTNNLGTRQLIWNSLIALWPTLPLPTQLFGYPASESPEVFVYSHGSMRLWENSMHSMYFGALPLMGYVGLVAYIITFVGLTIETIMATIRKFNPLPALALGCCITTAVFAFSYELRGESLLGLFIAIWMVRAHAQAAKGARMRYMAHRRLQHIAN